MVQNVQHPQHNGEKTLRNAQKILGLRLVSTQAMRYHPIDTRRAGYACVDAYRWRKITHIPGADTPHGGVMHRRNAAYRPNERPGRHVATQGNIRRGDSRRNG